MALPFNLPPTLFSSMTSAMNQPYMPMYQPQPADGISSAVSQISSGMDDAYTNRLLGALGLGDVSQYQVQQPMYQPMPFYGSPYGMYNPFMTGMFSPYMQQPMLTPDGVEDRSNINQDFSYTPTNASLNLAMAMREMPGLLGVIGENMRQQEITARNERDYSPMSEEGNVSQISQSEDYSGPE